MPCPRSVTIQDGVYGSARQPARRGQPVTFLADGGFFGSATTTSGTARLIAQTTVQVQASDIVWTPAAVTISRLPDLPSSTQPATWRVELTPAGEERACGPYTLVVEASSPTLSCPDPESVRVSDGVYGTTAQPAMRDTPVTLTAQSGVFGDLQTRTGSVTLTDGITMSGDPVPGIPPTGFSASVLSWLPTVVTFQVPGLPATNEPATWKVRVLPSGGTAPCGPYNLVVDGGVDVVAGILTFVPPLTVSERTADLVFAGLGTVVKVLVYAGGVE